MRKTAKYSDKPKSREQRLSLVLEGEYNKRYYQFHREEILTGEKVKRTFQKV